MSKKRQKLPHIPKQFDSYINGDSRLRAAIFNEEPTTQQAIFELFSQLETIQALFLLYYASIPSDKGLWEVILLHFAAAISGTSQNRNVCDNYYDMDSVIEESSPFSSGKDKDIELTGASHGIWFDLSDPNYSEAPNTLGLWLTLLEVWPTRMVWEWWFDAKAKELIALWEENKKEHPIVVEAVFEAWMEENVGLYKPRTHWYGLFRRFVETYELSVFIKHKIATPYLRLAYTVAKGVAAKNQPDQFFDTVDIACGGLMRAISKYAPSTSMAFSTFAEKEIRYEIFHQIGKYNLVALPNKIWQLHRKLEQYKKDFENKKHRAPTIEEMSKGTGIDSELIHDVYYQVSIQNPYSLDCKIYPDDEGGGKSITLEDKLEDQQEKDKRKFIENSELIYLSLLRLPLRQRKLFALSYNLCDLIQDLEPDAIELNNFFLIPHLSLVE